MIVVLIARLMIDEYIGIQEYWNQSISLFHKKYGGTMYLDELLVTRRASSPREEIEIFEALRESNLQDEYDQALYDYALRRFQDELKKI